MSRSVGLLYHSFLLIFLIYLQLQTTTSNAVPQTDYEYKLLKYKRRNCEGFAQNPKDEGVLKCTKKPDGRGLYYKSTCAGTTVTTTGFKTNDCRGTPQTHVYRKVGCKNPENEKEKSSIKTECIILEISNGPSPSSGIKKTLSLIAIIISIIIALLII